MLQTFLRLVMTASYSALLLVAGKPKVNDCSITDPSRAVKTIYIPKPLLFDALSTLRIHPSRRLHCADGPRVNSVMKWAKTRPLIVILGS